VSIPKSRRLDFSEIPVIDLSQQSDDDNNIVRSIYQACTEVGFFYITNHGVAQSLVADLVAQGEVLFALPDEIKNSLLVDQRMRGYLPLRYRSYEGEERAGTSHQEGFWIGHETTADPAYPLHGPNQWPRDLSGFQASMTAYFESIEKLSRRLLELFALALELPADRLISNFNSPNSRLKLNHYPPQKDPVSDNNIGVVPHSDSGCFTILWQDDNGGLEVQNHQGDWVEAPPISDSFVVNIGNIMQYWSNGLFSSTPHRVINRNGEDRFSIPFFVNPDHQTVIEPLYQTNQPGFKTFEYAKYQIDLWRQTFPVARIP
jgi:isopenicillin N synthase-like dioxygenase